MSTADDVIDQALAWLDERRTVALATVVQTWGSSPRPRGSQLAIRDDGLFVGSVSGGCVEGKVVEAALDVMRTEAPQTLEFGVSNEQAWEVGLACGGTVRIHVEPLLHRAILDQLLAAKREKRGVVLVRPLTPEGGDAFVWAPEQPIDPSLADGARRALLTDDTSTLDAPSGPVLLKPQNPPLRLFCVGAVHIALPLSQMASLAGYDVTLIDPREAFARHERWPGADVRIAWPDEVLAPAAIDHRTAIVTLTHDPKIDDVALELALRSPAFYVGALGSGKTHTSRMKRLGSKGFDDKALARIHGPVGLRIGARSPAEIAISILAQMTQVLRGEGA